MSKQLSWVPYRRGGTYCSPACGYGCTITAYRQAKKSAANLARRLGSGWRPDVWENIGWHYSASSPDRNIRVMPVSKQSYIAFLDGKSEYGTNPESAIVAVIKQALVKLHRTTKALSDAQAIYEEMKRGYTNDHQ